MNTILTLTLSGSALALLLLLLRAVFARRMPSTVYYYAWLLVLLRFVLPLPGLVPALSPSAQPEPTPAAVSAPLPRADAGALFPGAPSLGFIPTGGMAPLDAAERKSDTSPAPAPEQTLAPASTVKTAFDWRAPQLWLTVWAVGAGLCLTVPVVSYVRFTGRLRRTLRRPDAAVRVVYDSLTGRRPALYVSRGLLTPLMYGVFSPKIVLPAREYDVETLSNILRHELTHYRRLDTLYKWFAAAVLAAHWFNPLAWLIRREVSRACELSCDETLLRSMTRAEKQSYGNTLLNMAASSALPAGVVATTFSTEKKNLKERLEQIMHYKKNGARLVAALLTVAILAGCGIAAGPKAFETAAPDTPDTRDGVRVSTVDELLAAIAPNTTILLEPGEYDLAAAENYGKAPEGANYRWEPVYESDNKPAWELVIEEIDGLTLRGESMDETTISAEPRYANVIRFQRCRDLSLELLTMGHTREPGFCAGGVLRLEHCENTTVASCGLYGCGVIGVWADDCVGLTVKGSNIYECSSEAVNLNVCRDVCFSDCEIFKHGVKAGQAQAMNLFDFSGCDGVLVENSRIYNNDVQIMVHSSYSRNVQILGCAFSDSNIESSAFVLQQYPIVVDGCSFTDLSLRAWYQGAVTAIDQSGEPLDAKALESMKQRTLEPSASNPDANLAAPTEVRPGGGIAVKTVDEFLAAIGPARTITLDGELFDLSTASNYGSIGGEYYYWSETPDGPELVIHDVDGLLIHGPDGSSTQTTLAAIPRYANVLSFKNCNDLQLVGFVMGHTKEPGSCSGGVVNLDNCGSVRLDGMHLYGCGILGLQTARCATLQVYRTEIYECSQGAGQFFQTDGIEFLDCDIHDVPSPALVFRECGDKSWNGQPISGLNGMFDVDENGALQEIHYEEPEEREFTGAVEDLANPFYKEAPTPLIADSPVYNFAASVQRDFDEWNWPSLADKVAYPVQVFVEDYSVVLHDREEFLECFGDENVIHNLTESGAIDRIARAGNTESGSTVFGMTLLDHYIAATCVGDVLTEDNLRIRAISFASPLWPGRPFDATSDALADNAPPVPPTPQPAA